MAHIPVRHERLKCQCGCEEWFEAEVKTRPPMYKNNTHKIRAARKREREKQMEPVKALAVLADPPRCSKCGAIVLYAGCPCFSRQCFYDRLHMPRPMLAA